MESIYLLLKLKSDEVAGLLQEINIFKTLNRLVVLHEHNNLFHLQYHNIVTTILENDTQPLIQNVSSVSLSAVAHGGEPVREVSVGADEQRRVRSFIRYPAGTGSRGEATLGSSTSWVGSCRISATRRLTSRSISKVRYCSYHGLVAEWEQFKKNYFAKA